MNGESFSSDAIGVWKLDPAATTVTLQTKSMWGLVTVKAIFKAIEGGATIGADGSVSGTFLTDAGSVHTGIKMRDAHLRGTDFLDVKTYPTFSYVATSAIAQSDNVKVIGKLTVHGEERPFELVGRLDQVSPERMMVSTEFVIDRSHFGVACKKKGASLVNRLSVSAQFDRA